MSLGLYHIDERAFRRFQRFEGCAAGMEIADAVRIKHRMVVVERWQTEKRYQQKRGKALAPRQRQTH